MTFLPAALLRHTDSLKAVSSKKGASPLDTLLRQKDYLDDRRRTREAFLVSTIERQNSFSLAMPNKNVFAQVVAARNARAFPEGYAAYIERYNQGLRDGFEQLVDWLKSRTDAIDIDESDVEASSTRMEVTPNRERRRWAAEIFGEIGKKPQIVPEDDAKLYLCALLDRIPTCDNALSIEEFTRLHDVVFNQIELNRLHQQARSLDLSEDITLSAPSPATAREYLAKTFRAPAYRATVAKQLEGFPTDEKMPFLLQLGLDFHNVLEALHTAPCEQIDRLMTAYHLAPDVVTRIRERGVRAELSRLATKFRIIGSLDRWREISAKIDRPLPPAACQHPLHEAVERHAYGEIGRLAQNVEWRDAIEDGVTPLGRALRAGRLICAKTLLDAGAERIDSRAARPGDLQTLREMLAPYRISSRWDGAERDAATRRLQALFTTLSERNALRASAEDVGTARPGTAPRIARRSI